MKSKIILGALAAALLTLLPVVAAAQTISAVAGFTMPVTAGCGPVSTAAICLGTSSDVVLTRDAANTLALENGTNAQSINIYNTTDGTNKEWGQIGWGIIGSNHFTIAAQASGTGSATNQVSIAGYNVKIYTGIPSARTVAFNIDQSQHLSFFGAGAPTLSSCGTSPSAVTGSDVDGEFTTGTGTPTSCTVTFKVAWGAAPHCLVEDKTALANLTSFTVSTSAITLTTSAASSQTIVFHCFG